MTTNFKPHECVILFQSMKIGTNENKAIHSSQPTPNLYLRIEVHFFRLHWEIKGHWSCVNFVKREAFLKDLHATSVLSFPNANKN